MKNKIKIFSKAPDSITLQSAHTKKNICFENALKIYLTAPFGLQPGTNNTRIEWELMNGPLCIVTNWLKLA